MATTLDHTDWRVTELVMRSWTEPRPLTWHVDDLILIEDLDRPAPGCALPSYTG
ncbi:hypothetical protein ITP53_01755 [Nonomuraea sp. K274]|uniref:Uncharacterized protein n=1 Tax=Nonomuraea cypriaca TaxID=1187855 RepID=A0A931EUG4_9ACTN|nr:hypothetical protein [Nonomuraea cypriaca]MBF8184489.1 hypothetical protein [Nonomuraea cypriaca]